MPCFARLAAAALALTATTLILAPFAGAHRPPQANEYRAIRKAIDRYRAHFYCPPRAAVDVSTIDQRWAAAFAISNCGEGSIATRLYLRRPQRTGAAWHVARVTTAHGVQATPPCAPRTVPRDVRCGVKGRS